MGRRKRRNKDSIRDYNMNITWALEDLSEIDTEKEKRRVVTNDAGIPETSVISQNGFRFADWRMDFGKDLKERRGLALNQSNTGLFRSVMMVIHCDVDDMT
ncbi:hypothetical protein QQG55_33120 [Brugia pahangi]|uniref:Bm10545 n=4 Tax=Brugia TaxID=6278 RepID=A0A1I9G3U1_BRUMA|nr:Bm10545 [Brugia malayi]VDN95033.1 unnamed protein product [Brugia pahangi]VDO22368.1 unnamed protein product [Brugia timori]